MPFAPPAALLDVATVLPDAEVLHVPGYLPAPEALRLFTALRRRVAWRDETLKLFGREHAVPRRVAWYGDPGVGYRYSGQAHHADGWLPTLSEVRNTLQECVGASFNFVLANLYRDGQDAMGLHADDEPELGPTPIVASLSLGGARRFRLVKRARRVGRVSHALTLSTGDLVLMWGNSQKYWLHGIPRTRKPVDERINLTFRNVL